MIGDHGGFAHDDTNVIMLVANPNFTPQTVAALVATRQVAPAIVQTPGLDPTLLDAVQQEGTPVLPEVEHNSAKTSNYARQTPRSSTVCSTTCLLSLSLLVGERGGAGPPSFLAAAGGVLRPFSPGAT
jgi:hypothetical protein